MGTTLAVGKAGIWMEAAVPSSWQRLSTTELRSRQVAILDAVHRHCRDLGITYYLCAGTLLGAVRHQGYIPWDDDIDIMMPRHDYEKFIRTFPAPDSTDRYSVRSLETSPSYPFPFAKVCDDQTRLIVGSDVVRDLGIYVDVFPVDGWCEGRLTGMVQNATLHITFAAMRAKHLQTKTARNLLRRVVLAVAKAAMRPVSVRSVARVMSFVATMSRATDSTYSGVIVWGYRERVPSRYYGAPGPILFEGKWYSGPVNAKAILEVIYGDYMTLPPHRQRSTHHRFEAYLVE